MKFTKYELDILRMIIKEQIQVEIHNHELVEVLKDILIKLTHGN